MSAPTCPYCSRQAVLTTGAEIYPHRPDLHTKNIWQCKGCDARTGCHPPANEKGKDGIGDGTVPLGTLANAELRRARQRAHAVFDPLFKGRPRAMTRRKAYQWLAGALQIEFDDCHIAMFDIAQCAAVQRVVKERLS